MGALLQGIAAVATGDNHLITSAYLVSAMPLMHGLWRETVHALEVDAADARSTVEAAS
jgi:hypothetical protein